MAYPKLYALACSLIRQGDGDTVVNDDAARAIVGGIREIPRSDRGDLQDILNYADQECPWAPGQVATWPVRVEEFLSTSDKQFGCRPDGDNWEVYGVYASGEEDWVATVETETVAELLVAALNP